MTFKYIINNIRVYFSCFSFKKNRLYDHGFLLVVMRINTCVLAYNMYAQHRIQIQLIVVL